LLPFNFAISFDKFHLIVINCSLLILLSIKLFNLHYFIENNTNKSLDAWLSCSEILKYTFILWIQISLIIHQKKKLCEVLCERRSCEIYSGIVWLQNLEIKHVTGVKFTHCEIFYKMLRPEHSVEYFLCIIAYRSFHFKRFKKGLFPARRSLISLKIGIK
jgi:hypothetical protein